jgi:sulfur carrier protein ThiS
MEVEVTLYSPLQDNRFSKAMVNLAEPASIDTLLQHLTIEQHEVGSVYVNGKGSTFNHPLVTGDRVTLLPLIGGG